MLMTLLLHTPKMEREEQVRRILQPQKEKKKQISERQTISCCNVGLQSDLQSPCHMHSSQTPLTLQSEHQWGRHLVESTNIKKSMTAVNVRTGWRYKAGRVQNIKAGCTATVSHYRYVSGLTETPLRIRQSDKEYICFSPRNLTGYSRYKTSITTTSAVTSDMGGSCRPTVLKQYILRRRLVSIYWNGDVNAFVFSCVSNVVVFFLSGRDESDQMAKISFWLKEFFLTNGGVMLQHLMCWRAAPSLTV